MSEEVDEMDEHEGENRYCLRCEAEFVDPCEDDSADEVWSSPEKGFRGDSPYSDLCRGCASVHIRDDEKCSDRSTRENGSLL
jgi:hypothetical protein